MKILEKLGITKSKGVIRALSFLFLLLAPKYPEIFGDPTVIQILSALGFTIGQVRSITKED